MTTYELFAVQRDTNRLKSLYLELANHESFNPYKSDQIIDVPKQRGGKSFEEWYTKERERLLREIECYKKKIQKDREEIDRFIEDAPYPECDIIRFRVVNGLDWEEIGDTLYMDRRTAARRFTAYIKKTMMPTMPANSVI